MNLRNLKIFCEVYQTCNVTKAAENLYMSQPAVSRTLKEIEEQYGIQLFERFHHRLIPTGAGKMAYEKAVRILSASDELERQMRQGLFESKIRIGATTAYGIYELPALVSAYQKKHKDCKVNVFVSNAASLSKALMENQIDTAVIEDKIDNPNLIGKLFSQSSMVAVCGRRKDIPKHMKFSELNSYPLLLREKGSASRRYVDAAFTEEGMHAEPVWESESTQALIRAASYNLGIAIVPSQMADDFIERKMVRKIEIDDHAMIRKVYITYHKDKYLTAEMKDLISMIAKKE